VALELETKHGSDGQGKAGPVRR